MEKKKISLPIITEGRYDKNTLSQIFDCTVFTVDGFAVFNSRERQALLRRVCEKGAIILVDSDGGGRQIRSFLSGILPPDRIHHAYIPRVEGRERRKTHASRAGLLGVEGMSREVLETVLAPFVDGGGRCDISHRNDAEMLTIVDFFKDGFSGGRDSSALRDRLARHFALPEGMTAKALLAALNIITDREGYTRAIECIRAED